MSKASKESVEYGPGHRNGDHCGICRHFDSPHACEVVAGRVEDLGWCKRFIRKRRSSVLYTHPRSR